MSSRIYGIDFGTSTIKIYKKGEGIILDEKNIIAIENKKAVKAVGDTAFEMYGKTPANIAVTFPVKNGVISDIQNMQSLLNILFKRISGKGRISAAEFYVAVPTDITEVERRAFIDLIECSIAKPKAIRIVEKPIADALGVGLDVTNARGVMTVNIGADTTEISIMSLGGIVLSKLIPIGGNKLDDSIQLYVKKKYNLVIGAKTSEILKKELACADNAEDISMKVFGRNVVTGLPVEMEISSAMVYDSISDYLHTIVDSIKIILERTPPEISSDIIDSGIYFTGGSASIKNLDKLVEKETELSVNISQNPAGTVISGLGRIIEEPELSTLSSTLRQQNYSIRMRN